MYRGANTMSTNQMRLGVLLILCVGGCMVGPNYQSPPVQTTQHFKMPTTAAATTQLSTDSTARVEWWKEFNDPVLDKLVEIAYGQNLTLQQAGLRVLESRARRGIAVGLFFPQLQSLNGSYSRIGASKNDFNYPNQTS